jgi:CRP-like cAMP-binding protein
MIPERETGRLPFHSLSMGEAIREIDIFSGMSDRQTDVIASIGHMLEIPLGQELGRVGERGSHLFAIISGRAQLSAGSGLGEITVRIVGPGETFPLAALIESGTLVTTAKAMTDMELIAVPCEQLREMCARDPDLGMRIYEAIATVFQRRYRKTLVDLSASAQKALREAGFFTNV